MLTEFGLLKTLFVILIIVLNSILITKSIPVFAPHNIAIADMSSTFNSTTSTNGYGTARLIIESEKIQYNLVALDIGKVTEVHLHNHNANEPSDIIATLYSNTHPSSDFGFFQINGNITDDNLDDSFKLTYKWPLTMLQALISNRLVYVDIHTDRVPSGEIEGLILPQSRTTMKGDMPPPIDVETDTDGDDGGEVEEE